jgi:tRNA threonylcarbamoyladenosine biosynthesis protein TsaB
METIVKLLALDTSTEACSVALHLDGAVFALDEVCPQQHSKRVLPMVQHLLATAGISLQDLDGIVFGRGPGSFTGVRIGVGVCQGLAFGADLPVFGVSTLAAMAQAAQRLYQATEVVAAIDARMAEVYFAQYRLSDNGLMLPLTEEIARKPTELPDCLVAANSFAVGTGFVTYATQFTAWAPLTVCPDVLYPSAQDMLTLATPAWQAGEFIAAELAEPIYVRDEVTWQKLPGR